MNCHNAKFTVTNRGASRACFALNIWHFNLFTGEVYLMIHISYTPVGYSTMVQIKETADKMNAQTMIQY